MIKLIFDPKRMELIASLNSTEEYKPDENVKKIQKKIEELKEMANEWNLKVKPLMEGINKDVEEYNEAQK
jgi:hypothetical protein